MIVSAELDKLKLDLINWISSLDNERQLQIVDSIRLTWTNSDKDWWDELSTWEKEQIEKGMQDVEEGRVLSSEEFWKKFKSRKV